MKVTLTGRSPAFSTSVSRRLKRIDLQRCANSTCPHLADLVRYAIRNQDCADALMDIDASVKPAFETLLHGNSGVGTLCNRGLTPIGPIHHFPKLNRGLVYRSV